jgi:PAS domain S-box-containing protein
VKAGRRVVAHSEPRDGRTAQLEAELKELRARLADAEQTLRAIGNDDVDAVVVKTRARGNPEVLTIGGGANVVYEHFFDAMQEGALTVDEAGVILHANRRMAQLAGRDDLAGASVFALLDSDSHLRTILQNVRDQGMTLEAVLRRTDGKSVPVAVAANMLPVSGPRMIGLLVNALGTNKVKPDETVLQVVRSAQPYEAVLEHLPTGTIVVDARTGCVTYANRRAEEILGFKLIGAKRPVSYTELSAWRRDGTFVEPEQLPVARVVRGELVKREDLMRSRPDGTFVQTRSTAVPILGDDGEIESVLVALEDASEEYVARVERESDQRFAELFVAILGHDLRDPLNAIVTGTGVLKKRATLSESDDRVLGRVWSAAFRMARMIDQIHDFTQSRLGGGMPMNRRSVSIEDIVRTVVGQFETSHPGRTISLAFEGPLSGQWDPDRIEQVVSNLVANALAHGAQSQPVRLDVRGDEREMTMLVHNQGDPIPTAVLPFVFDPFRRARASNRGGSARGLGLGLYIVQQIVHAHGGTITVDSSEERGTSFTVVLPRDAPRATAQW